jgi:ribonucleotide monophosphatase NagD (HAD superfamily)
MVGDSLVKDVRGAQAVGIEAVLVDRPRVLNVSRCR